MQTGARDDTDCRDWECLRIENVNERIFVNVSGNGLCRRNIDVRDAVVQYSFEFLNRSGNTQVEIWLLMYLKNIRQIQLLVNITKVSNLKTMKFNVSIQITSQSRATECVRGVLATFLKL